MTGEIASRGVDRDRAMALDDRFAKAFAAVIQRWPSVSAAPISIPTRTAADADDRQRIEALAKSIGGSALRPRTRGAIAHDPSGGNAEEAR
jgi:hypothetical protein